MYVAARFRGEKIDAVVLTFSAKVNRHPRTIYRWLKKLEH